MRFFSSAVWFILLVGCGPQRGQPESTQDVNQRDSSLAATPASQGATEDWLMLAGTKGNGGDAVVCFDRIGVRTQVHDQLITNRSSRTKINPFKDPTVMKAVTKLEVLDLYEYKIPTGFPPIERPLIEVTQGFAQELQKVITRLRGVSGFADELDRQLRQLPLSHWRKADGVVEIDDSAEVFFLPEECLLVQVAVRQDNIVYYDEHLWQKMDELNRLGLVTHELVYKVAAEHNQSSSEKARQAVGLLLSKDELLQLAGWELHARLKTLGNYSFTYVASDNEIEVSNVLGWFNFGPPKDLVVNPKDITIGDLTMRIGGPLNPNEANLTLNTPAEIGSVSACAISGLDAQFEGCGQARFVDRLLRQLYFKEGVSARYAARDWSGVTSVVIDSLGKLVALSGSTKLELAVGSVTVSGIEFSAAGSIAKAKSGTIIRPELQIRGTDLQFDANENLTFIGKAVHADQPWNPASIGAGIYWFRVGETDVEFYPSGAVKSLKYYNTKPEFTGRMGWTKLSTHELGGLLTASVTEDGKAVTVQTGPFGTYSTGGESQPQPNATVRILDGEVVP